MAVLVGHDQDTDEHREQHTEELARGHHVAGDRGLAGVRVRTGGGGKGLGLVSWVQTSECRVQVVVVGDAVAEQRLRGDENDADAEHPPRVRGAYLHDFGADPVHRGEAGARRGRDDETVERGHRIVALPLVSSRKTSSRSGRSVTS